MLIPTAIFTWVALRTPVNFDGAMNLQLAQYLAHNGSYSRFYHVLVEFPPEVKTNGPFIFLAAASIAAVGDNQLGVQLANLLFVAGTAAVVHHLFRHWEWFAVAAPTLTLLLLPQPFLFGLAGLGEIPAIFFLLLGLVLLYDGLLTGDSRRALRLASIAFLAVGLAITTKTFMAGSLPAVAVAAGALIVVTRVPAWKVLARVPLILVGPLLFELYRLISLGSSGYGDWWDGEWESVSYQAGIDSSRDQAPPRGFIRTLADRLHIWSERVELPAEFVIVGLVVTGLLVVLLVAGIRRLPRGPELTRTAIVPMLSLGVLVGTYAAWWIFVVPEAKAWTRRLYPALVAQNLVLLLLLCTLASIIHAAWGRRDRLVAVAGASLLSVAVVLGLMAFHYIPDRVDRIVSTDTASLDSVVEAAEFLRSSPDSRFFGEGWWSAPVVSLMADRGLYDLEITDPCDLDPDRDRVIWDRDAAAIAAPGPFDYSGNLEFTLLHDFGEVQIYAINPTEKGCPSSPEPLDQRRQ